MHALVTNRRKSRKGFLPAEAQPKRQWNREVGFPASVKQTSKLSTLEWVHDSVSQPCVSLSKYTAKASDNHTKGKGEGADVNEHLQQQVSLRPDWLPISTVRFPKGWK